SAAPACWSPATTWRWSSACASGCWSWTRAGWSTTSSPRTWPNERARPGPRPLAGLHLVRPPRLQPGREPRAHAAPPLVNAADRRGHGDRAGAAAGPARLPGQHRALRRRRPTGARGQCLPRDRSRSHPCPGARRRAAGPPGRRLGGAARAGAGPGRPARGHRPGRCDRCAGQQPAPKPAGGPAHRGRTRAGRGARAAAGGGPGAARRGLARAPGRLAAVRQPAGVGIGGDARPGCAAGRGQHRAAGHPAAARGDRGATAVGSDRWLHPPALPLPGRLLWRAGGGPGARAADRGGHGPAHAAGGTGAQLRKQLCIAGVRPAAWCDHPGRRRAAGVARGRTGHRPLPAPDPPHRHLTAGVATPPAGQRMNQTVDKLSHVVSDAPRVMVVDGSRLVRKLIADVLARELDNAAVVRCASIAEARRALAEGAVDLVTTSLALPDGDGIELARAVREAAGQAYVPVIVVSGDAQSHLEERRFTEDVTDYFDKALGHAALATFIRGYVQPEPIPGARVLYVEDSRVVALATKRMLERQQLEVLHFVGVEEALEHLEQRRTAG